MKKKEAKERSPFIYVTGDDKIKFHLSHSSIQGDLHAGNYNTCSEQQAHPASTKDYTKRHRDVLQGSTRHDIGQQINTMVDHP